MKSGTQKLIAQLAGYSPSYICEIVNRKRLPSWRAAKRLARATGVDPVDWMELSPDQLRARLGLKPRRRNTSPPNHN